MHCDWSIALSPIASLPCELNDIFDDFLELTRSSSTALCSYIVLQFDINVPGGQPLNEDTGDIPDGSGKPVLDTLKLLFPLSEADGNRDAILEELVGMIQNLHTSQSINEVVFPLRHLYRLASIKPEYLKSVDGYLYEGLKKKFEVGLKPIVLIHQNYEGDWDPKKALAYPFVSVHDEHKGDKKPLKRRKIEWKSEIHLPARYELTMISSTDYIGNEAQTGEGKYFGAGILLQRGCEVKGYFTIRINSDFCHLGEGGGESNDVTVL